MKMNPKEAHTSSKRKRIGTHDTGSMKDPDDRKIQRGDVVDSNPSLGSVMPSAPPLTAVVQSQIIAADISIQLSPAENEIFQSLLVIDVILNRPQIQFIAQHSSTVLEAVDFYLKNTGMITSVTESCPIVQIGQIVPRIISETEPLRIDSLKPFEKDIYDSLMEYRVCLTRSQLIYLSERCKTSEVAISYYFENQSRILSDLENEEVDSSFDEAELNPLERSIYTALRGCGVRLTEVQLKYLSRQCSTAENAMSYYFDNMKFVTALKAEAELHANSSERFQTDGTHSRASSQLEIDLQRELMLQGINLSHPQIKYISCRSSRLEGALNYYFDHAAEIAAVVKHEDEDLGDKVQCLMCR